MSGWAGLIAFRAARRKGGGEGKLGGPGGPGAKGRRNGGRPGREGWGGKGSCVHTHGCDVIRGVGTLWRQGLSLRAEKKEKGS